MVGETAYSLLRHVPPPVSCDFNIEVKKGASCENCSNLTEFNSRPSDCRGETSDGENRFYNWEVVKVAGDYTSSSSGKRRYKF
jgi:hypothetical protein